MVKAALMGIELTQDLPAGIRHKGFQKLGADRDGFHQVVKNLAQAVLLQGIIALCEHPGSSLVDILVAALKEPEDLGDRVRDPQLSHLLRDSLRSPENQILQILIDAAGLSLADDAGRRDLFIGNAGIPDNTAEVFVRHGDRPVHQIAKRICQIGIEPLHTQIPGDHTVIFKRHLMQDKAAYRVHAEKIGKLIRVQDIALGLTHLAVAHQQPRVAENLLRKRLAERHQEDRPVDRMETDDILPDQVQVSRPVPAVFVRGTVRVIAGEGDIVAQRVKPHINHVLRIKVHRDSPGK